MSNFQAARQAASFIARKNRRSRQFIDALTPWRSGMPVTEGMLIGASGAAWIAQSSGTAGANAPTIGNDDTAFDGAIYWTRQWRLTTGG